MLAPERHLAAIGEPLRYLSNEISRNYDPDAVYTYDPERSLSDFLFGIIMPFAQRRQQGLTPEQDLRRLIYNADQQVLEKLAPGHSLLVPPPRGSTGCRTQMPKLPWKMPSSSPQRCKACPCMI